MLNILALVLATFIWGAGFVATRWTFIDYSPIWSNSLRFAIAGIISVLILLFRPKKYNIKSILICSIFLFAGLQLQTIGIKYTSLAKSGFLTSFYAIFTPILCLFLLKSRFRPGYWGLVFSALTGIVLLCEFKWDNFNIGDMFILSSALFFSLHILAIDHIAKKEHSFDFNLCQCVCTAVMSVTFALIYEGPVTLNPLLKIENLFIASSLSGFVILAIFSSIIAFSMQIFAQKRIPPHIASLVFMMEAIFAAFFGYLIFAETLSPMALTGAAMVLVSVSLIPIFTNYKKTTGTL